MKAKDHFIDWLREKILLNPQDPPAGAWQEISDSLDVEESWEKINEELEFNAIWEKIDNRLNRYNTILRYERLGLFISSVAAIVFLMAPFLVSPSSMDEVAGSTNELAEGLNNASAGEDSLQDINDKARLSGMSENSTSSQGHFSVGAPDALKDPTKPYHKTKDLERRKRLAKKSPSSSKGLADMGFAQTKRAERVSGTNIAVPKVCEAEGYVNTTIEDKRAVENRNGGIGQENRKALPQFPGKGYLVDSMELLSVNMLTMEDQVPSYGQKEKQENIGHLYPSLYLGGGTAVKMSWLWSKKTLYAMERSSLLTALPAYKTDWYVLYGAKIKDRLFLQGDLYIKNAVGQEFKEYRMGQYGVVKDHINYQSLSLTLSHLRKAIGGGKCPTFGRLLGGLYGGKLQSAQEISHSGILDKTGEYKQIHFGGIAGYEYDTFLGENFMLSYGLRGRIDLLNLYAGTDKVPAHFRSTRGISLDFSLSLKYRLKD